MAGKSDRQRMHISGQMKVQVAILVLTALGISLLVGLAVLSWLETTA